MPEVTLVAEAGRTTGSRSTRRLRAAGKIPGVVYGHGAEPLPVAVGARDFQLAMSGEAGLNTLLSLKVDGKDYLTLARDIQRHPFKNVVTHVDFLIVRRDEVISAEVIDQPGGGRRRGAARRRHRRAAAVLAPGQGEAGRHPAVGRARRLGAHHRRRAARVGHRHPRGRRARHRPRDDGGRRSAAAGAGHRGGGRSGRRGARARRLARKRRPPRPARPRRPSPSRPRRARSCSATGGERAAREARSTCWWSVWATRVPSSRGPATTPAPTR